jgi:ADP-ribosylglycohydrolase
MRLSVDEYIEKLYAGWLGKVIGVRFGAPIEGWTYQKIKDTFGELDGYTRYYHDFGGDDDTNVPLFLIRGLDNFGPDLSPFEIGHCYLDFTPLGRPFFWLGGYGVSTEHTALMNLRAGMEPSRAGSAAQNGLVVAEQIGGQIFIDPWGYVTPGKPDLAVEYAKTAACVTHDKNGIYGGQWLAACISHSFVEKDMLAIIKKGLEFIPIDCEYARVANCVIDFWEKNPANWHDCYKYIFDNFGYDRYGGNCHIIPNEAVMILSMLYGEGNFERTMNIVNMCGWDTDCNAGNVGSIIGIVAGIENINYNKWIKPLEDQVVTSSTIGYLNSQNISNSALYMAKLGCKVMGWKLSDRWKETKEHPGSCCFELPYSVHGLRAYTLEDSRIIKGFDYKLINTDEDAFKGKRCLKLIASPVVDGQQVYLYKRTYLQPCDFSDPRYDPAISPIIYPGQNISVAIKVPSYAKLGVRAQLYVKDLNSNEYHKSEPMEIGSGVWKEISWNIPALKGACLSEAGVCFVTHGDRKKGGDIDVLIDDLLFSGKARYSINFKKEHIEVWTKAHHEVSQFVWTDGFWTLDENNDLSGSCYDTGFNCTGDYYWQNIAYSLTMIPLIGEKHYAAFRVKGAVSYYAAGFDGEGKFSLIKFWGEGQTIRSIDFAWKTGQEYRISINAEGRHIKVSVDNMPLIDFTDSDDKLSHGCVGMSVKATSRCLYRDVAIEVL